MKSSNGVTLISVITYVIGMTVVLGVIATLMSFFYNNVDVGDLNSDSTQYTKFSSVFLDEINKDNNRVVDCKSFVEDGFRVSYIVFTTGNQFTFMESNGAIYRNQVKICDGVEDCEFSFRFVDSRYLINVSFRAGGFVLSGEDAVTYTL